MKTNYDIVSALVEYEPDLLEKIKTSGSVNVKIIFDRKSRSFVFVEFADHTCLHNHKVFELGFPYPAGSYVIAKDKEDAHLKTLEKTKLIPNFKSFFKENSLKEIDYDPIKHLSIEDFDYRRTKSDKIFFFKIKKVIDCYFGSLESLNKLLQDSLFFYDDSFKFNITKLMIDYNFLKNNIIKDNRNALSAEDRGQLAIERECLYQIKSLLLNKISSLLKLNSIQVSVDLQLTEFLKKLSIQSHMCIH
jgi:hypothetical protein